MRVASDWPDAVTEVHRLIEGDRIVQVKVGGHFKGGVGYGGTTGYGHSAVCVTSACITLEKQTRADSVIESVFG